MKRVDFRWVKRGGCRHPEIMTLRDGSICATDYPAFVGIIRHPEHGIILFDTGYDPAFFAATQPFPERFYRWATPVQLDQSETAQQWLAGLGIDLGDVKALVLSHFHGDHVAGLTQFPNATIYCSRAGLTQIQSGSRFSRVRQGLLSSLVPQDIDERAIFFEDLPPCCLPAAFGPFDAAVDILGDGSLLGVELPGHCQGHWGLALRTHGDGDVLLIADAAWSIGALTRNVPPPRLTTSLLGDTRRYRATLSNLHAMARRNNDLIILPSHCPTAAKAFEKHAR
jgi:glyoxylase-like metal-dependent hydrolase (beta-lactamase superfamily II)